MTDATFGNEIIVSAQERVERLQDVPEPVTANSREALTLQNKTRIRDFLDAASVSGVGQSQITVRGVTSGGKTYPVVGNVNDDVFAIISCIEVPVHGA